MFTCVCVGTNDPLRAAAVYDAALTTHRCQRWVCNGA